MAKPDSSTIIDTSQDAALTGVTSTSSTGKTTMIDTGPLPDNTYVNRNVEVINEPGGNVNEVQVNVGGKFVGDTGLTYNNKSDQLNVKGNLNVGGYIKGKIVTNTYNFFIQGGTDGQVLTTDGTGNLRWVDQTIAGTNYSNANVGSFLPIYDGNIAGGNIAITGGVYAFDISSTGTAFLTNLNVNAESRLGSISNVKITGGTSGQMLTTDGAGNLHWSTPQQGATGPKGDTGATGSAATITLGTVTTGAAGTSVQIVNSGDTSAAIFDFTIPRGDHGEQGPKGDKGDPGVKGDTGDQGPPGADGLKGDKGDKGDQGVPGNDGQTGATGATGPQGLTGATGPKGDKGDQGVPGNDSTVPGPKGDTGAQGVSVTLKGTLALIADLQNVVSPQQGDAWIITETGGNLFFYNSFSQWDDIGKIVGPQGDKGDPGPKGDKGDQGVPGNDGQTGAQGDPGPAGAQGDPGPKGDKGDQGVPGNDGIDGTSLVWKGEWNGGYYVPYDVVYYLGSTYICTVDNLNTQPTNTSYWEVMTVKGEIGPKGDQGDQGPRGYGVDPGGTTGQVLVKSSDNDYDTVWRDPAETSIHISDVAPSNAIDGTVWWNSEAGRSFIKYNQQWVDMSPQQVINPNIDLTSITFSDGSVQTSAGDLGNLAVSDYATLYDKNTNNNLNLNEGGFGDVSLRSFKNDVKIISDYVNTSSVWNFKGDGNLTLPTGGKIGSVQLPFGTDVFTDDGSFVQLNYANNNFVWVEETGVGLQAGDNIWYLTQDNRMIFPDGTAQETAYTGEKDAKVQLTDFPPSAEEGTVWYNTELGRAFVKYQGQWVDFSPQVIDPTAIRADEDGLINLPTGGQLGNAQRIHQNAPGGRKGVDLYASSKERWVQLNYNEDQYIWADKDKAYIEVGSNTAQVESRVWEFDKQGNITFPDNTIQSTAYQGPATLLDGGGANSTYVSNIPPAGIINPFDQDLNTTDNVHFVSVTANSFIGTATSVVSVPVGNITGLGNISVVNLDGNSSNVLYGNGVFAAPTGGSSSFNGTMNGNTLLFDNSKVGAPTVGGTTDRINLFPAGVNDYSYGIGIEDNHTWFNAGGGGFGFKFYNQGTRLLTINNGGITFPDGTTQSTAATSGSTYGDSNVQTFLSSGTVSSIAVNGGVSANYFLGPIANGQSNLSIPTTDGNVYINANTKQWNFGHQGNIVFPDSSQQNTAWTGSLSTLSNGSANLTLSSTGALSVPGFVNFSGGQSIQLSGGDSITLASATNGTVGIIANGITWRFGATGNLVFPDSSQQNTAWTGTVAYSNVSGLGNIATINLDGNSANILYGNGVFAAPAPSSSYSNSNVAAYLLANPEPGTYSNTNVASYLSTNTVAQSNVSFNANVVANSSAFAFPLVFANTGNSQLYNSTTLKFNPSTLAFTGAQTGTFGQSITTTSILAAATGVGVFNTTATTINMGGAANVINIGASNVVATFGSGTGNISVGNLNAVTGTFTGTSVTGVNSLLTGPTFTPLANTMAGFNSNVNSYTQLTIQNKSTGADATTDFIATADNGNDSTNYLDMGIINSGYDNLTPTNSLGNIVYAADSYIYAQGNTSATSQSGGNLAIGTTVAGKTVKFFAGGNTASSLVATIANTGANITGNLVVSGNITGANISGNISITGNVTGTSSNVTLVAGSYSTTFDNTGVATMPGVIKMANLPAFRVYGTSTNDISAGTTLSATQGLTVDYNQTSSYNNTTGLFTAPVAGIYHTSATVRIGSNNGLNQAAIIKNSGGSANTVAFWETDTNTGTAVHFGMSGYIKLAVGDTLKLIAVAGKITFDSNDQWSVTFVG